MSDTPTPLNLGDLDLSGTLFRQVDDAVTMVPSDETHFTHHIVPREVWSRIFEEKIDANQVALRRGVEIDKLRLRVAELEKGDD